MVGIQALSYRNSSCSIFMSHTISINYLDLDQTYATHEFQVQSKFLYQINLIQNSGEFNAENKVLERNYNRATIHHFHFKRLS
jgi:hypothetical protein